MSQIINQLNMISEKWLTVILHASWQAGLVGLIILAMVYSGKKWSSAWKYGLLMIVLLKFVTPPFLFSPVGLFSQFQISQTESQEFPATEIMAPQQNQFSHSDSINQNKLGLKKPIFDMENKAPVKSETISKIEVSSGPMTESSETRWPSLSVSSSLLLVWLAGFVLSSLWLLRLKYNLVQITRRSEKINDTNVNQNLKQYCQEMKIKIIPDLYISSEISIPFATGIISPKIFIPKEAEKTLTEEQLNIVLQHELAHQKRGDLWVNSIQNVMFTLWWFHPVYWLLNRKIQTVREECCDDYIISHQYSTQEIYCETLLHVARNSATRSMPRQLVSMAHSKNSLTSRINRLMENKMSYTFSYKNLLVLILFAIILIPGLNAEQKDSNSVAVTDSKSKDNIVIIKGTVTDSNGKPISGADVAVIGDKKKNKEGGDFSSRDIVVAEAKTNSQGYYQLALKNFSVNDFHKIKLIALSRGQALSWREVNLNIKATVENIQLEKERPIQLQLVDENKKPLSGVKISLHVLKFRNAKNLPVNKTGAFRFDYPPAAWPAIDLSDKNGMVKIHGTSPNHAIYLRVAASNQVAPQFIALNPNEPKQEWNHPEKRHVYYNVEKRDKIIVPLTAPQFIKGVVLSKKTNQPIPNVRITIFSGAKGKYPGHGLENRGDKNGKFQLNPYPGFEFWITIFPPKRTPYLLRSKRFNWDDVNPKKEMEFKLSTGILVKGVVTDKDTKKPIPNAFIEYNPEAETNPNAKDESHSDSETARLSNSKGEFQIAVLPGVGRLLIYGPKREYIYEEVSGGEIYRGKKGGPRYYAHAIIKINPSKNSPAPKLAVTLTKGKTLRGQLLSPDNKPVKKALLISRLFIQPGIGYWRGHMNTSLKEGQFELTGCDPDKNLNVHFLDPVNKLGATLEIKKGHDFSKPLTVHLEPCGKMKARILKPDGSPQKNKNHYNFCLEMLITPGKYRNDQKAMMRGELFADSDLLPNIDRLNFWDGPGTDEKGNIVFDPLIPGAVYQWINEKDDIVIVEKEFTVKSGETLDLGDITMKLEDE